MKYLEEESLEKGKYYHVISYNDEHAVLKYEKDIPYQEWGFGIGWGEIRYVLREMKDLEEAGKRFL